MKSSVSLSRAARTAVIGLVLAIASIAGLSLAAGANAADDYPPTSSCSVGTIGTTASVGSSVGIAGSGFAAGSTVALTENPGGKSLGTVTASSKGSFETTVSLSTGNVTIVASSGSMTCASTKLGTDAITEQRADSGTGPTETASTGFQSLTATVIAGVLLLGGLALVLAGRRRTGRN
jgi:hypothetical protein